MQIRLGCDRSIKLSSLSAEAATAGVLSRGKLIGSNLVIFCSKEIEKFVLYKSVSQLEVIFIVFSEPIESGHVKIIFHNGNTFKM